MFDILNRPGYFGTSATILSDTTLVLMLITAILFTIGWRLAVHKKTKAHRRVQTAAVSINTLVVMTVMVGSYWMNIVPGIPAKLTEISYAITTLHGLVGVASVVMGIYMVLRGYNLVPKKLRFRNYKPYMRTTYILYMLATLLGVIVYLVVFIGNPK